MDTAYLLQTPFHQHNDDHPARVVQSILTQNLQFAIICPLFDCTLSSDGLGNKAPPIISQKRGWGVDMGDHPVSPGFSSLIAADIIVLSETIAA